MNITELDSYNLADAVKFHNRLNPRLWGSDEQLLPEVRSKLLEIAADFQEFLGLSDLDVEDITLSGSNAAYSYTPHSDIDLHLVVNVPKDEVYQELFNAKKYQYNDLHNIKVRGADVELYVQPADETPVSLGEYSIKNNQWIEIPKRKRARVDQSLVRHKYEDLKARIESALKEDDSNRVQSLIDKIKAMRRAGLDEHGEFGPENLAYKMLRNQGWIQRLYDHVAAVKDRELSLKEQEPKKTIKYGFKNPPPPDVTDYRALFKPTEPAPEKEIQFNRPQDYEWYKQQQAKKKELAAEDAGETWDGVNPTTCMFLNEDDDQEQIVHQFIEWAADKLGITKMPEIFVHTDPEWSVENHSFGRYEPDTHSLHVNMANRHLFDILRTTAHELAHCKQNQVHELPDDAGDTGSRYENEAHAAAGIIMRDFADAHPELFAAPTLKEASGYIPTKKQAKDPRFSMALTVDVKPGQTGKEANKMSLDTDSQGKPAMIYKSANQLHETLAAEFAAFSEGKSYGYGSTPLSQVPGEIEDELGNQEATGPESPPQMPAGTTKIDVSDLTDWYRLGMDISDLDDADPADYNQGPPQTVIVFPSDEAEQGYLKQFKRLGLKTHDMDPDVEGGEDIYGKHMRGIKEAFDQPYNIKWEKSEYGDWDALATLDDGTYLSIMFEHTTPYEVAVSFWRNNSQEVTGEGDAQRVFATVLTAMQQFLKQEQPANISFSAQKEDDPKGSRSSLYKKLVQRYAQSWGYRANSFEHGDRVEFELTKIKQDAEQNDVVESLRQEFALLEDEYLGEIKMSPSNLRSEAAKTGAQAGMEFEMIVPNVNVETEPEYELDMDQDTRSRDFDDIRSFFHDGDYNSRRDVDHLMQSLQEQFDEWGEEQIYEAWADEGQDYMREYIETNDYWDDAEAREEATNALQAEYGDSLSPEEFQTMLEQLVKEKFDEFVQQQWDDQDQYYEEARDQYFDEQRGEQSEREWLNDTYPYMSDIQANFDITWPYFYDINQGDGEMDIDTVANDFSEAIGRPINASSSYHGARREPGHYVVEPDGSLEPDDSDDGGLEFVSPPMPIDELIDDLNKVKAWADSRGCYTNNSTGLHINVSVPDYSLEKLDYIKLALLMGDQYVLDQFGRAGNTYTKAAIGKIRDKIKQQPERAEEFLDKMRNGMGQLASKAIHSGTTDKYTSINTKSGYIEFRSPGGDWLDANFDKIENTLLRFTVALSAAINPEAYRQEYLKKLYKLLEVKGTEDPLSYFARYAAGEMPKAALKSFVKQAQLQRRIAKDPTGGQQYWWEVSRPGYFASIQVVASSKEEAVDKAVEPGNYPDWASARNTLEAKPIKPYDSSPVRAQVGEPQPIGQQGNWGIWLTGENRFSRAPGQSDNRILRRFPSREAAEQWIEQTRATNPALRSDIEVREIEPQPVGRSTGAMLGDRPSNPEGNWVISPESDRSAVAYRFLAADRDDAALVARQWRQANPGQVWITQRDDNRTLGQPAIPGSTVDLQRQRAAAAAATGNATNPLWREPQSLNISAGEGTEYIIFNINDRSQLTGFRAANQAAAEREAESILRDLNLDPDLYDVRPRHPAQPQATQQPAPPTGSGREFAGWRVLLPTGEEVYRFSGVGNSQSDANRIAADWLRRNGMGVSGEGYEVVPMWREA